MTELFFDLSNNNGPNVNIGTVLAHSCSIVLKATEGARYRDPYFARWAGTAIGLNKPWVPYHFARPGSSTGTAEATNFCDFVESATGGRRPWRAVYDFEATSTDRAATTRHALEWGTYVAGRWPDVARTLYSGFGFQPKFVPDPALKFMFGYWHSGYPGGYSTVPNPDTVKHPPPLPPFDSYLAWQFTSIYPIPGAGRGDANICLSGWHQGTTPQENDDMTDKATQDQLGRIEMYAAAGSIRSGHLESWMSTEQLNQEIDLLYRELLGRSADAPGLKSWTEAARNGATRQQVHDAIASTAEGRRFAASKAS